MGPGRWARIVAAARRRENAMTSRTPPPTSLPMDAPRGETPRRYVDRRPSAYWKRFGPPPPPPVLPYPGQDRRRRSEEHTSELQSRLHLVCRLLLEKKK